MLLPRRGQRRDRLRRRHRQELPLPRHHARSALPARRRRARSSLTVPLRYRDQVIGTFNVESPQPNAFGESDVQYRRDLLPRRGRRAAHAGIAVGGEEQHGDAIDRGRQPRGRPAGGRHPRRRHVAAGPLHRPRSRHGRQAAARSSPQPARSSSAFRRSARTWPRPGRRSVRLSLPGAARRGSRACASWWPTTTTARAARHTACSAAGAASSRPPATAARR